jgi:hypothetical protein
MARPESSRSGFGRPFYLKLFEDRGCRRSTSIRCLNCELSDARHSRLAGQRARHRQFILQGKYTSPSARRIESLCVREHSLPAHVVSRINGKPGETR